jgi:uncharacterized protein (DUF849 family)
MRAPATATAIPSSTSWRALAIARSSMLSAVVAAIFSQSLRVIVT